MLKKNDLYDLYISWKFSAKLNELLESGLQNAGDDQRNASKLSLSSGS